MGGNGNNIQIQRNQWIPRKEGLKVANFTWRPRLRWVNQLIDPVTKEWNHGLTNRIFNPFDASEIVRIRIPKGETVDCVAWHYENSGNFTVKSAYRLEMATKGSGPRPLAPLRVLTTAAAGILFGKRESPEKLKYTDGGWLQTSSHQS